MLAALLAALVLILRSPESEPGFAPVRVSVAPIAEFLPGSDETRFGLLEFMGGIAIASPDRNFGSLSGIDFLGNDRTLLAVADTGFWFRATLAEETGRPTGLNDAALGPILDADGRPPSRKSAADAEGLRLVPQSDPPQALVSFEVRTALREFSGPDFALAKPTPVTLPGFVSGIRRNQGLEAVAIAPVDGPLAGAVVVFAERSLDGSGNHHGFVLTGPRAGAFAIRRTRNFDITDAVFLPGGDLVVLERRFNFLEGFAMRMRRFAADAIRPGVTLDGTFLMAADDAFAVDNMEGLAVRPAPDGAAILTLVSDDNGSWFQRTLLLQFRLAPVSVPMPHLRP